MYAESVIELDQQGWARPNASLTRGLRTTRIERRRLKLAVYVLFKRYLPDADRHRRRKLGRCRTHRVHAALSGGVRILCGNSQKQIDTAVAVSWVNAAWTEKRHSLSDIEVVELTLTVNARETGSGLNVFPRECFVSQVHRNEKRTSMGGNYVLRVGPTPMMKRRDWGGVST